MPTIQGDDAPVKRQREVSSTSGGTKKEYCSLMY
jgi:hypothetical protein